MTSSELLNEEDLHAFIDDELDEERAAQVAGLIAAEPALREMVAHYRADKEQLAAHYGPLLQRPLPVEWRALIARPAALPRSRFSTRPLLALAASVMLLFAGWGAYEVYRHASGDAVIAEAITARDQAAISSNADAAAISAALGLTVKLPDLSKAGYALAGVAISPATGGHAVKISYRNHENRLFTLYLKPSSGREQFDLTKNGDLRICLWQDDVLATVMLGEMSAAEMLRVASLAYNGLYF